VILSVDLIKSILTIKVFFEHEKISIYDFLFSISGREWGRRQVPEITIGTTAVEMLALGTPRFSQANKTQALG